MRKIIALFIFSNLIYAKNFFLIGKYNYNEFLGCIDWSKIDLKSICGYINEYKNELSTKIFWNQFGLYGGLLISYSPWNEEVLNPPKIIDKNKNFLDISL